MSEGSIVAIVVSFLTFAGGFFVTLRGFRQDALNGALQTINEMQERLKALHDDIANLENTVDQERQKRRDLATDLDTERIARESVEAALRQANRKLDETTQIKISQAERINRLETLNAEQADCIAELEDRLKKVEKKTGPLDPDKAGE